MYDFCENCDKDLADISGLRVDAHFCSEGCKIDYHNTKRKAQRKLDSLTRAILDLEEIAKTSDNWKIEIGKIFQSAQTIVRYGTGRTLVYQCRFCHRLEYGIPEKTFICPECQHSDSYSLDRFIEHKTDPTRDEPASRPTT